MNDKDRLRNLPALDIFAKLFEKTFHCSLTGDAAVHNSSKVVEPKHLSLLFAWPGILEMELAAITGNKEYKKKLDMLRNLLHEEAEYPQIRDFLDDLIKLEVPPSLLKEAREARNSGDNEKLKDLRKKSRDFFPKVFKTLRLLLHSKSIHMEPQMGRLAFLFGNYHILCCMIVKLLEKKKGDAYITKREIKNVRKKCEIKNQFYIYSPSQLWMDFQTVITKKYLKRCISFNMEEDDASIANFIEVPSIKMNFHTIKIAQKDTYAFVEQYDKSINGIDEAIKVYGMAFNMNPFVNLEHYLWRLIVEEEISDNKSFTTAFLFLDPEGKGNTILSDIRIRLTQIARQSSLTIQSIINSWETFIENSTDIIDQKIDKLAESITPLLEDYELREEFFDYKAFSRIIGDLDTELEHEIVKEIRGDYEEANKYHISIKRRRELLEAKEELDIFVRLVIKNPDVWKKEEQELEYFDENRSKFTYLKLLKRAEVRKIKFSTEGNAMRNNRRKILTIINKKLGGKPLVSGSTLTKLLRLEKGEAKYMKYAK